jgi:hypothetical protein
MPDQSPFRQSVRFGSKIARCASWICLALAPLFAAVAMIAPFFEIEGWDKFLYASGASLFTALRLARGNDPSEQLQLVTKPSS